MATLYLVRHGQASFMSDNYDVLSPLGQEQAQILGSFLKKYNYEFDACYAGTLSRHLGTFEGIQEKYQIPSKPLPSLHSHPGLNEHQGAEIHYHHLPTFLEEPENQKLKKALEEKGKNDPQVKKGLLKLFFLGTRLWAQGKIETHGFEAFPDFKTRVKGGFEFLETELEKHKSVLAVSSGGTIAMLLGFMMGLSDEKVIELNWQIRNTSITEVSYSRGKFYLRGFNHIPHFLGQEDKITFV